MKYDSLDTFTPTFVHSDTLRELEEQLFGHVLAAIDFDMLHRLEWVLGERLAKELKIASDVAFDLALQMIGSAIVQAANDPARHGDFGPPDGVTEEEAKAVAFDESCALCVAEAEHDKRVTAAARDENAAEHEDGDDGEPCLCCEELVRAWREQHADVLAKAGLARPKAQS